MGFPRERAPSFLGFATPRLFWERVVTDLENGVLASGGIGQLVAEAYRQYPGNRTLRQIHASLPTQPDDAR
ncbi:effector-associated domain EAD1-containing protein [Dactylosporangium sucinum]|nr:effector-associated domain EAD1-containing protein [Dactylosporangium sucinum]